MKRVMNFLKSPGILWMLAVCFVFCNNNGAKAQTYYSQSGGTVSQTGKTYTEAGNDTSGVYVTDAGVYTLANSTVSTTGVSTSSDSSSQYGLNAVVLANLGSSITISGSLISGTGTGANAAYATGAGSIINLTDDTLSTKTGYSHGVDVTYTGTVKLKNVVITTLGNNSSGMATDFGGGTVTDSGGTVTVSGVQSAGIYSTGLITAVNAAIKSNGDDGGVTDAGGTITITNTTLTGAIHSIMVHNTTPVTTPAEITVIGGAMIATGGDCFHITGAPATLTLKAGATVSPSTGNIIYVDSASTATFIADGETVTGNIYTDSFSATVYGSLSSTLENSTVLTGTITRSSLTIDATSEWKLNGTSYIETLTDATGVNTATLTVSNITGNGYNVYYHSGLSGNSWLDGKTYSLTGGGCLLPVGATCTNTGVNEVAQGLRDIKIYPNPANDGLNISFGTPQESTIIKVMGIDGKIWSTCTITTGATETSINIRDLADGLYILVVESGNGKQIMKFTKD